MVKTTENRQTKTSVKYDPYVTMLRIKALQNLMKRNFVDPAQQHEFVDENLTEWLKEVTLPYGKKGSLYDFIRKVVWDWLLISDDIKTRLHDEWLAKGLPESLWLKIAAKNNEIMSFHKTHNSKNILVTFEVDCFPYPDESINPAESDYVQSNEVLPLPVEYYTQPFWRQKTVKYGSCDYITDWCEKGMDEYPTILAVIEIVQPLIYEKPVFIFAHLTEPYQSPLDKLPTILTSYETESGSDDSISKDSTITTSEGNKTLPMLSKTPSINISYDTTVT